MSQPPAPAPACAPAAARAPACAPACAPASSPAPLSNAERQRRWRARLKAKASGAAVADHARDVAARAILALWAYHERPGPSGTRWAEIDGCRTIEEYVLDLATEDRGLVSAARAFLPGFEGLMPEEARAIAALIDLADVIALRDTCNEGVLGRLLAPAPEPRMALVPPHSLDLLELDTAASGDSARTHDPIVRLTAARRARRRALRQTWQ